jgi:hypothetical protein
MIMCRTVALAVVLVGAAGCGGAGASAREPHPIVPTSAVVPPLGEPAMGLHPGESMTFAVSLGGVEAGEAAFAVGEQGVVDGKPALVVTSRIASAGLFKMVKDISDNLTSTIDLETGLPVTITADVSDPPRNYHADGRFAGGVVDLDWYKQDGKVHHTHYDFGDVDAHDAHTAMASVRTWDGEPGDSRRLYVIGGRRIWQTDVTWVGRETIGTALGNIAAVRLDGVSVRVSSRLREEKGRTPRTFSVWMSDDGDRVPLRVVAHTELGDIVIELTGYERP